MNCPYSPYTPLSWINGITKPSLVLIQNLREWGQEYQALLLVNYADNLSHALEELDIDRITSLLESFPDLRNVFLSQL